VEEFDAQVAANLRSVFLVSGHLRRHVGEPRHIFNMSSVAGLQAFGGTVIARPIWRDGLVQDHASRVKAKGCE